MFLCFISLVKIKERKEVKETTNATIKSQSIYNKYCMRNKIILKEELKRREYKEKKNIAQSRERDMRNFPRTINHF
jgi:hypothetical protein